MQSISAESTMTVGNGTDLDECRERLRVGSRSFHAAAYLLPRTFREPASALYSFCRSADDAVDTSTRPAAALALMHRRLDALYAGTPYAITEDRALAAVVRQYDLPKALVQALFEGFAWDVQGRRYANLSAVIDYAARVAGTVGAMMAVLMGVRDRELLARATDLGVAMQLTNIARDVGEDARAGRLYLPEDWLEAAGVDAEAFLREPRFSAPLGQVIARLLGEADRLYRRADSGIARLPARCRPAIYAARLLYAEIGNELLRMGCDSVSARAVVSGRRKLRVLSTTLPRLAWMSTAALRQPALEENAFLVAAVTPFADAEPKSLLARVERKYVWVLDLFEEMDRRDRARSARPLIDETVA